MKLTTESIMNPYYIGGRQVRAINFYNADGVQIRHEQGWLSSYGSSKTPCEYLESLEFRNARKIDLSKGDAFTASPGADFGGKTIEIYVPMGEHVELVGERVALETDHEICYGIYFKVDGVEYMRSQFSRTEYTAQGRREVALGEELKAIGVDSYHARKLLARFPVLAKEIEKGERS